MIHTTTKASRIALRFTSRTSLSAFKEPIQWHKAPFVTLPATRYLSVGRNSDFVRTRPWSRVATKHQVRYCSHRRAMCLKNADVSSGSVEAPREVLPTNVKPLHYDLTLEPDFEKFTYNGTVVIEYVL